MDQKYHVDNRSNIFVRYASTPDGDDFSDRPDVTRPYIGILATGYRYDSPIREDFKGLWQEYRGRPGTSAEVHIDPITYTWVINGVDTGVVALAHDTAMAKSYCNGQTGLRDNEERDNAMFYKQAAESAASLAEESLNEVKEVLRQISAQNELIQEHIRTATELNDEMTGKVAHADAVREHVDEVQLHIDSVDELLTEKYNTVVLDTQEVSDNKDLVISIKTQIQGYVSTAEQYANQTSTDKGIAVAAADRAGDARDSANAYAKEAKSYARGGTGTRTGEDTDNGLYYLDQTRALATDVSTAHDYITSNTQMMTFTINDDGYLIGQIVNANLFSFSISGNSDLVVTDTGDGGTLNIGPITAYGEAVQAGYVGTYAQFSNDLKAAAANYTASETFKDEAKAWAEGSPSEVSEYGGVKSSKDWAEDAKQARDTVIEFMNQTYVYGLLTDMTIGQTDAAAASRKVVYDNMTHELVPVDSFVKEPCHNWRRLLLTWDNGDQVRTYLDPHDSRRLASGGNADLTGAAGDVMVRLPGVHNRKWQWTDETNSHRMEAKLFSTDPFLNSVPDPGTLVGSSDGNPVDQLVGAFMGCHCNSSGTPKVHAHFGSAAAYATGDRLRSIVGCRPAASIGASTYRTMAHNAGLECINWETHRLIADLMAVHFGTYDIESAFCHGFNYMDTYTFRYFRKSGRTDVFGNGTGVIYAQDTVISTITVSGVVFSRAPLKDSVGTNLYGCGWEDENTNVVFTQNEDVVVGDTVYSDGGLTTSAGTVEVVTIGDPDCDLIGRWNTTSRAWTNKPVVMSFQGLEYPWGGGQYIFGDGGIKYQNGSGASNFDDSCILTCLDPSHYTGTYNHPTIPTGYTRKYLRMPKSSKWASWYDIDTMMAVVPDPSTLDFTGAANRSLCDYWYNDGNAGVRAIYRGGPLSHGAFAGPFYVYVNFSFSSATVPYGARVASTVR